MCWRVCLRPSNVEPGARQWAVDSETGTTVSDIDKEAFEAFLPHADVVYIFDFNAPAESAQLLPFGHEAESCDGTDRVLPRQIHESSGLPSGDSNPLRVAGDFGPHTEFSEATNRRGNFVGMDDKKKTTVVPVFRVCVRPPGIHEKTLQWAATQTSQGMSYTTNAMQFQQAAQTADRIFIFDQNAPPESVYEFGPPFDELRCPGKPAPKPRGPMLDQAKRRAQFEELVQQAVAKGPIPHEGLGGSSKPTWSSSSTGKGASLSFFEAVVRQTLIAQGILSGDVSGDLKDPNGARYGIPNGKNPDGPNLFFLQFTAATFSFLPTAVKSGTQLIKRIAQAAKNNAALIIAHPDLLPKKLCERLVERYGDSLAPSFHQMQTIMPYGRALMFTAGWRQVFQAHHILEKEMAEKIFKMTDEELAALPAIILKDKEHQLITKDLNRVRKHLIGVFKKEPREWTPDQLWRLYTEVYGKDYPIWLESIKSRFGK